MALFECKLPTDILKDINFLEQNSEKIFGGMCKAGAQVVCSAIKKTAPHPAIASNTKISKVYRTPTDGGINAKVYFSGYIPKKDGRSFKRKSRKTGSTVYETAEGIPTAFLAILYEYGRSGRPFPKKPFFRAAFLQYTAIRSAMLAAQKELSEGILEN